MKRKEKIIARHDSPSAIFPLILSLSRYVSSLLSSLSLICIQQKSPVAALKSSSDALTIHSKKKTYDNNDDTVITLLPFPVLVTDDRTLHALFYSDGWTSEQREETDDGIIDYSCI